MGEVGLRALVEGLDKPASSSKEKGGDRRAGVRALCPRR